MFLLMRNTIWWALVFFVALLGGFSAEQIKRHGRKRLWTVIPVITGIIILIILMLLPGAVLFGIIE